MIFPLILGWVCLTTSLAVGQDLFQETDRHYLRGEIKEALDASKRALTKLIDQSAEDRLTEGHYWLGKCYEVNGHRDSAASAFGEAISHLSTSDRREELEGIIYARLAFVSNDARWLEESWRLLDTTSENLEHWAYHLFVQSVQQFFADEEEEALTTIEKAISLYEGAQPPPEYYWARVHALKGYMMWKHHRDFQSGLKFTRQAMAILDKIGNPNSFYLSRNQINIVAIYLDQGLHRQTLAANEDLYRLYSAMGHTDLTTILNNLGNNYKKVGEYALAIECFKKIIAQSGNDRKGSHYNGLGDAYFEAGHFDSAMHYLQIAIDTLRHKEPKNFQDLGRPYHNLGLCEQQFGNYDRAIELGGLGLKYRVAHLGEDDIEVARSHWGLSESYRLQGDLGSALDHVDRALQIHRREFPAGVNEEMAQAYLTKARVKRAQGEIRHSAALLDSSLLATGFDFRGDFRRILSPHACMETLMEMADQEWSVSDGSEADLLRIRDLYLQVRDIAEYWRYELVEKESKSRLVSQNYRLFDQLLAVSHQLVAEHDRHDLLPDIFGYFEESKAILLAQTLQHRTTSAAEDPLYEEWSSLDSMIHYLQFVHRPQPNTPLADSIMDLKSQAIRLRRQIDSADYKVVAQSLPDLSLFQRDHLPPGELCLEYFMGEEMLGVLAIAHEDVRFHLLPLADDIRRLVSEFRQNHLQQKPPNFGSDEWAGHFTAFCETSHTLYQHLVEPFLRPDITKLLIVPDGILSHLPFELLIEDRPDLLTGGHYYRDLPFLFGDRSVRYMAALRLLTEVRRDRPKTSLEPYLGMAPTYDSHSGVAPLNYNQDEVRSSNAVWDGRYFLASDATEQAFRRTSHDHDILHLSMHALVDDLEPALSKLLFTNPDLSGDAPDPTTDNALHFYEVQNLDLQARLVALSACNTGVGKVVRGEGILNLARSFFEAGADNVLMTLWNANDWSSRLIMEHFFQEIKAGQRQEVALQDAKRNYLFYSREVTEYFAHPYFWSQFVLMGAGDPIQGSFLARFGLYLLLALVLLIFVALAIRQVL